MAVADYLERIGRYVRIERRDVKSARGEDERARAEEGKRLLRAAAIGPADRLVALSPHGESLDSPAWSRMVDGWQHDGTDRIVFVVGGVTGLAPIVLEGADRILSFGSQTMSHELVQVVLAEQLYRAWSILRGTPYHK